MAKKQQKGESLDTSTSQEEKPDKKGAGKKAKAKVLFTPKGTAKYPWLFKPDTRFDEEGVYHMGLLVDPKNPEVATFLAYLKKETGGKGKVPFKREENSDLVCVKFKSGYPPTVVDSAKQPVPPTTRIGNGSAVKVAFTVNHYKGFGGGVNLYLQGVQLISLTEFQRDIGFNEEEGYKAEESSQNDGNGDGDLPY
jgi:hypothetical protein